MKKVILILSAISMMVSCNKKEGCTNPDATNYDSSAKKDDGSCIYLQILSNPGVGVTFDGYNYSTIELGNGQEWMVENLRTTIYSNGDIIPNVTDQNQWSNLTTGAWSHYNNDSLYENPYGKLYNWYVVDDSRNVCPTGWHVPTDLEWTVLTDYLGYIAVAGGKMKSTGTQYWQSPNTEATNESGFSGLPGGVRIGNGSFGGISNFGEWWSSTEVFITSNEARTRYLTYNGGVASNSFNIKKTGHSVRCLKD
jgi:uncharacterized protein (TIGR02145 family)